MLSDYVLLNQLGTLDTIAGVVLPNLCSALVVPSPPSVPCCSSTPGTSTSGNEA
ncbi:hypothetical protein ACFQH9_18280 [Pseudonocardia lutea]|jgi:hypothetical protein|uniref:Hydrophobin n=1 Tax=Pseudonocardia lutea TaxID=2172015 RepID=A0ABW1IAW0_9PSEU